MTIPGLWDVLTTAGGTVALTFIVALALGIASLTLLFLGSAVVVLERFARSIRRPRTGILMAFLWMIATAIFIWDQLGPEARYEAGSTTQYLLLLAGGSALLVAVALLISGIGLRLLQPMTLARASLVALGLGYACLVGGSGQVAYAVAPVGVCGLASLVWAWWRKGSASAMERSLWVLTGTLTIGIVLTLVLPEPDYNVSLVGVGILRMFVFSVALGLLPLAAAGFADSHNSFEWFIAVRYLLAKRRQTFISVISLICVGGVAVGVWLIITVLSVMNGAERIWREEIIGNRAHFTVQSRLGAFEEYASVLEKLEGVPDIVAASPFLDAEGMVRGEGGEIVGVRVRGVDPTRIGKVTELEEDLIEGSLDALGTQGDGDPAIVIGSHLSSGLGIDVGDSLILISPFGGPPTPLGPGPRLKRFEVVGVFRSSFFQYEEIFTYVGLPAAQDFRRTGDVVDGIEVRVTDYYRSRRVGELAAQALQFPYYTRDWKDFFPAFFQALKTERVMMFVLLSMVMVVAAFVIVATLVMMIMEKTSDIAILKAMGASDRSVERIFAIEGTLIGLVGTIVGVIAGIVVTTQLGWIQKQIEVITGIDTLPASVYNLNTLPWELDLGQIVAVAAIAMILALGATLIPSRQGARLDPAESLRYE